MLRFLEFQRRVSVRPAVGWRIVWVIACLRGVCTMRGVAIAGLAFGLMVAAWFGGGNPTQTTTALLFAWVLSCLGMGIADLSASYILAGIVFSSAIFTLQIAHFWRHEKEGLATTRPQLFLSAKISVASENQRAQVEPTLPTP